MLLSEARRPARVVDGVLMMLPDQDRARWDRELIDEGHDLVRGCLRQPTGPLPAPDCHQRRAHRRCRRGVDRLGADSRSLRPAAGPLADTRGAAPPGSGAGELDGPRVALALVDQLHLTAYQPWHAARADLLRRLGRLDEAVAAYDTALALTDDVAEHAWLAQRKWELPRAGSPASS